MEYYYLVIVVMLFALAISDLIVGVSNDAVNFLNSAIGSKAASYNVIMIIAALGILVGATFSSGMMEVARKGIFHPEMFYFNEIMIIFMAVMLTDIILLDLFNTYGLPTSTTVSIVFELLGAAVAVSIVKISHIVHHNLSDIFLYINSERALAIISGIFISIVIAFSVGAIIQWIVRMLFTFNTKRTIKIWGGIWGGISVAAISYFMLVKGAKGASFISDASAEWIAANTFQIILFSFIGGSILFQLLISVARVNILKIIVLMGTFALAMAFAGNDLVNFIGVPLAGFESFKAFSASGAEPGAFAMDILTNKVQTPTLFLLIAGLVMALTLRFSKKARSVTATTINLSSQKGGNEQFQSSAFARWLVRWALEIGSTIRKYSPSWFGNFIGKRFDQSVLKRKQRNKQEILAFDLVRASVNLVVAAILISIGTSLKLPLSTTYVTFMVTMGSSLTDQAWGRESAVFRITGVLTVIGGWFLTALSAFAAAFIIAILISFGGMTAIVLISLLVIFLVVKTHVFHNKKEQTAKSEIIAGNIQSKDIVIKCSDNVKSVLISVSKLYYLTIINFTKEKRKALLNVKTEAKEVNKLTKKLKLNVYNTIQKFEEDIESGHHYVQVLDYLKETSNCLQHIINPVFEHVDNNHHPLDADQIKDLLKFNERMAEFFNFSLSILEQHSYKRIDELKNQRDGISEEVNNIKKKLLKKIKQDGVNTRVSMVYLDILTESKNLSLFVTNVIEANMHFMEESEKA
ncbi:MAG: inorganic phosphate transporter [Bacteroidales bacterium]|nr:inorganic phosphate transporter [Bacteroidales bacterium]MCF8390383.1 inorganic phosphate transporter [Bacteroidales bacterium]